jgi:hypothetical protein
VTLLVLTLMDRRSPSIRLEPLFHVARRATGSVFVFYFSTDKTPRPTGYSLTVDDTARASERASERTRCARMRMRIRLEIE